MSNPTVSRLSNLRRFATRPFTLQRDDLAGYAFWHSFKLPFVSIPLDQINRATYVDKVEAERAYKEVFAQVRTVKGWHQHLAQYRDLLDCWDQLKKDITQADLIDQKELARLYRSWVDSSIPFAAFIIGPYAIEYYVDPYCRALLAKAMPQDQEEIFAAISSPGELVDYQRMRLAICEVAMGARDDKTLRKLAKDYGWYNEYAFIEPLFDEVYFASELDKLTSAAAQAESEKIHSEIEHNRIAFQAATAKIANPDLQHIAEVLHVYTFLRTDRVDKFKQAQAAMRDVFDGLAKIWSSKTGQAWSRHMVVSCSIDEIQTFFNQGIIPDRERVELRLKQQYVYFYEQGKATINEDTAFVAKVKALVEQNDLMVKEIKGVSAYRGKVSGLVVKIFAKQDLQKVKQGDVLVAKFTMVDYMPAMRRAVAFVTEEGGITSHAAIVARELKKPCIVGTGNCTKVLNDGDRVEVDAEKGIVKIL